MRRATFVALAATTAFAVAMVGIFVPSALGPEMGEVSTLFGANFAWPPKTDPVFGSTAGRMFLYEVGLLPASPADVTFIQAVDVLRTAAAIVVLLLMVRVAKSATARSAVLRRFADKAA